MFTDIMEGNAAHKKEMVGRPLDSDRKKELKNLDIKSFTIPYFASCTCWHSSV